MSKCKNLLALALATVSVGATAASLPTGYDEIRTADGTMCRASTASTTYLTVETYSNKYDDDYNDFDSTSARAQDEVGIKASIVVPLSGGITERVDCSRFADLELQRMQAELEQTKLELEMMKQQQSTWE